MPHETLQDYEAALGPEEVDSYLPAKYAMRNLASHCTKQGRLPEARRLLACCQAGLEIVSGAHHEM
ncbi:hypothetical protein N657DRAFT_649331 [Parathielavia appendiculata]|uniref:Uncharacterized protein n=1 Tax=Parathielavia appendiculata TaxID=2587402 RepID=A0AAN6Z186_9PEZI|nr:hypothetical protein N657DRAFT_649331 [Parathielavia appendiculata]